MLLSVWQNMAIKALSKINKKEAALIVMQVLKEALGIHGFEIVLRKNSTLTQEELTKLNDILQQLLNHKPISKIFGYKYFLDLKFSVNENVLDPRVETEKLVEAALKLARLTKVCELGTGSGCISISLQKICDNSLDIVAIDKCEKALEVAKANAKYHNTSIKFIQSDWFDALQNSALQNDTLPQQKFDLIISNPPYLKEQQEIGKEVKFDPACALYAGKDGLDCYRKIISQAGQWLEKGGCVLLEVPSKLAGEVCSIARSISKANIIGLRTNSRNIIILCITFDVEQYTHIPNIFKNKLHKPT